jgi:hypothetical protein
LAAPTLALAKLCALEAREALHKKRENARSRINVMTICLTKWWEFGRKAIRPMSSIETLAVRAGKARRKPYAKLSTSIIC